MTLQHENKSQSLTDRQQMQYVFDYKGGWSEHGRQFCIENENQIAG